MKTIRRLYFFLVAFISVEVVLWALIGLLRLTVSTGIVFSQADTLAQTLAVLLVGVPMFLLHWGWAQRAARADAEEHAATLRAVFLYGLLLATLIPVVQNVLALLSRSFIALTGLEAYRALVGGSQSWSDNLIAVFFNLTAAAYFYRVTQFDWLTLLETANYRDVRRLYRYIWVLYGLLLLVFGAQQLIAFLLSAPFAVWGAAGSESLANGLALLLVGVPLWFAAWQTVQRALAEPPETTSTLRLGILYLLALGGVVTVLSAAGVTADTLLRLVFGEPFTLAGFVSAVRGPLSVGIPLGAVWAYYGRVLAQEIQSSASPSRRAGLRRLYFYVLALIGLAAVFIGLSLLLSFLIVQFTAPAGMLLPPARRSLSAALAVLAVSLPLWLLAWRPVQAEALREDEEGENARRSLVRRSYLYLVIFAAVLTGMGAAIALFYQLLTALLGSAGANFTREALNALQLLVLSGVFLAYHWSALRRDGGRKARALTALQEQFPVLVFEQAGSGFAPLVQAALSITAPHVPAAAVVIEQGIPEGSEAARAVILPSTLAFNPPEALRVWLKDYDGHKIIVPVETPGWYWPGGLPRNGISAAAQMVRQLAEGQEVRVSTGAAAWQVVAYVFAVLFAIQLLFALFALALSLVGM